MGIPDFHLDSSKTLPCLYADEIMVFCDVSYWRKFINRLALAERHGLSYTDIELRSANANPFMNFSIEADSAKSYFSRTKTEGMVHPTTRVMTIVFHCHKTEYVREIMVI